MNNNNDNKKMKELSSDSGGSGVLGSLIFMILAFIFMYLLSKYIGN